MSNNKLSKEQQLFHSLVKYDTPYLVSTTVNNKKALEQQQSFCYKRIGNTFCFYGDRYGNPR